MEKRQKNGSRRSGRSQRSRKIGRPIPVLYHAYVLISVLAMRLRGVRISFDRSGLAGITGPALLVCPHISMKDHVIVAYSLFPKRPTFVLSEHFIFKPFLGWPLKKLARVITKKMFCADAGTILNILRAKKEDNIIVLFPEGRLNAAAHSQPVTEGSAALVKKLGVDVYTVAGSGSALVYPKWGERPRKGEITVTTARLASADEISGMSERDISEMLDRAINHDDEKACLGKSYKCRDTSRGLDGILYKCPVCNKEFSLYAGGCEMGCTECGFKTRLGYDYLFESGPIKSVNGWFYWQKESLDMNEVLEDDVTLGAVGKKGVMDFNAGSGHIVMTRERTVLDGELFGSRLHYELATPRIGGTPYTPMREFDIYCDKRLIYITPQDRRRIMKYVHMVDRTADELRGS